MGIGAPSARRIRAIPKRSATAAMMTSALSGRIASGTLNSRWARCGKRLIRLESSGRLGLVGFVGGLGRGHGVALPDRMGQAELVEHATLAGAFAQVDLPVHSLLGADPLEVGEGAVEAEDLAL